MAIAIPMISAARQAANNSKCRANLVQLHTAIISHAKSNDDFILENLASNNDLTVLIDNGYLDADSKLGDCPGQEGKQKLSDSSYVGGKKLDGINGLLALTDNDVILYDKSKDHHKAGINTIHMDGSFSRSIPIQLNKAEQKLLDDALIQASKRGKANEVQRLIDEGAQVNVKGDGKKADDKDWTGLHWASWKGHVNVVHTLLNNGADINAHAIKRDLISGTANNKLTPLHLAAYKLKEDVIKRLIAAPGVQLNAQDGDGDDFKLKSLTDNTPLHWLLMNDDYVPTPFNKKAEKYKDIYYRSAVLLIDAIANAGEDLHLKNRSSGNVHRTPRKYANAITRDDVVRHIDRY